MTILTNRSCLVILTKMSEREAADVTTHTYTDAKKKFLTLCRAVSTTREKAMIRDSANRLAIVVDSAAKKGAISLSAQAFKDEFSRCASLVKTGVVFKLTIRNHDPVYVRRHTGYNDPLDQVTKKWIAQIEKAAVKKAQRGLVAEIVALQSNVAQLGKTDRLEVLEGSLEDTNEKVDQAIRAIRRLDAGYAPMSSTRTPRAA